MTPVQWVAAGLLLVTVDAFFGAVDAVPDPLGWALVLVGLCRLRRVLPGGGALLAAGAVAGLVSVPVLLLHADAPVAAAGPSATGGLPGGDAVPVELQWVLSLPQLVATVLLCRALAARLRDFAAPGTPGTTAAPETALRRARNLGRLGWVLAALALVPPVVYGGGLDGVLAPAALAGVLAQLVLLWGLVALGRHPALLAPGPQAPDARKAAP